MWESSADVVCYCTSWCLQVPKSASQQMNGSSYTALGTHWNALPHCFQCVPEILTLALTPYHPTPTSRHFQLARTCIPHFTRCHTRIPTRPYLPRALDGCWRWQQWPAGDLHSLNGSVYTTHRPHRPWRLHRTVYEPCNGHIGRTGLILYIWPNYTPSKGPSNCPKC